MVLQYICLLQNTKIKTRVGLFHPWILLEKVLDLSLEAP